MTHYNEEMTQLKESLLARKQIGNGRHRTFRSRNLQTVWCAADAKLMHTAYQRVGRTRLMLVAFALGWLCCGPALGGTRVALDRDARKLCTPPC